VPGNLVKPTSRAGGDPAALGTNPLATVMGIVPPIDSSGEWVTGNWYRAMSSSLSTAVSDYMRGEVGSE